MVLWFMLACQGSKNEAPQSVPTDVAEDTSIERDTAPPLPPGCDGVPGSEKTYDACRVCDGTAQTCDAEMVLGYVAAGTTDNNEYICLDPNDSATWFPCNRDVHQDNCPVAGTKLDWGPDERDDFASINGPITAEIACQSIFGELQPPVTLDGEPVYPEAVNGERSMIVDRVSAVIDSENEEQVVTSTWHNPVDADAENATSTTECPVYSCAATNWCGTEDDIEPPPQCVESGTSEAQGSFGYDWSLPVWSRPPSNSGFFGKNLSADHSIQWAAAELSWRQLLPQLDEDTAFDASSHPFAFTKTENASIARDFVHATELDILDEVMQGDIPYWLRIYTAAKGWGPEWLTQQCPNALSFSHVHEEADPENGIDEDQSVELLPIWDDCVWQQMLNMYKYVLGNCLETDQDTSADVCPVRTVESNGTRIEEVVPVEGLNLRAKPEFLGIYVPGAFRYAEYAMGPFESAQMSNNYESAGASLGELYVTWFEQAVEQLVALMGGPDAYAHKLIFTGEDFPYSIPDGWDSTRINHQAMAAVSAGMSIRNGITENHSTHHYHTPAYGTFVDWTGHVVADPEWIGTDGKRLLATEQECFGINGSCGKKEYNLDDPSERSDFEYQVTRANLVSLQARMNYMYVKPSVMDTMEAHWTWVEHNLTQQPEIAAEAWITLGAYRDRFFESNRTSHDWFGRPWIQNTEKFLVQRDVCRGGKTQLGSGIVAGDAYQPDSSRMTNIEGRATQRSAGQDFIYLDVDDAFANETADYRLAVSYVDGGGATWSVEYESGGCLRRTATVTNASAADGELKTVWLQLEQADFVNSLPGGTDLRIYNGGEHDIEIRMLRLQRVSAASCGNQQLDETEQCDDGNILAGDGCDPSCHLEENWWCGEDGLSNCECSIDWSGNDCRTPICTPACDELHGSCIAPDTCACDLGWSGDDCSERIVEGAYPKNCDEVDALYGSDIYTIYPTGNSESGVEVFCEMDSNGGGWTIVWASTDDCNAGYPWEAHTSAEEAQDTAVDTGDASGEDSDCPGFGIDPRLGRVKLDWELLQQIPQQKHIFIRPNFPSWLTNTWLRVDYPFFSQSIVNDLQQSSEHSVESVTVATSDASATAMVGFATPIMDWEDADGDGDTTEVSELGWIRNGGWYGLAETLSGSSESRRFLNGSCANHYVFVYGDNHMSSKIALGMGWPSSNVNCSSSADANTATWIGIR